ncbi:hypothetical protein EYF80_043697 [Liparis tanakae]|uniref:Uncharacterized protein n=1 Tax=Liparis tanakae TaxID=230148 RepID=A0A4Z2G0R5_9TELE|nr:hypothetical protein EYF80_043697 [Liparis tanakae]
MAYTPLENCEQTEAEGRGLLKGEDFWEVSPRGRRGAPRDETFCPTIRGDEFLQERKSAVCETDEAERRFK